VCRGGALLLLVLTLVVPAAYAEDDGSPFDPLDARARPPIGSPTTREEPVDFFEWLMNWLASVQARSGRP
jgi:hypothetical protein